MTSGEFWAGVAMVVVLAVWAVVACRWNARVARARDALAREAVRRRAGL